MTTKLKIERTGETITSCRHLAAPRSRRVLLRRTRGHAETNWVPASLQTMSVGFRQRASRTQTACIAFDGGWVDGMPLQLFHGKAITYPASRYAYRPGANDAAGGCGCGNTDPPPQESAFSHLRIRLYQSPACHRAMEKWRRGELF